MNVHTKEVLRWLAIVASVGFALWTSTPSLIRIATRFDGNWISLAFGFGFIALLTAPFYIVAYICFIRKYRELYRVLGIVGAIVIFGILISLPSDLHLYEFLSRYHKEMPWTLIIGIPISLFCLIGPFYAASLFIHMCNRKAQHTDIIKK